VDRWENLSVTGSERAHALRENLDLSRQLLAAVGQAVIATDLHGTVNYWNAAAERLYGWTEAEALGVWLGDLILPVEQVSAGLEIIDSVLAGQDWTGEFTVLHRDGHPLRVLVTDSAIRDPAGLVVGVIGVSTDITERTETEQSLRRSEGRLRARFEQSGMPQLTLDVSGRITTVNGALCRLLQMESDQVLDRLVFDLFPPVERSPKGEPPLADVLSGRHVTMRTECSGCTSSGAALVIQIDLTALRDEDNIPYALDGHVQDLTGLRRAEQALRVSEARYRMIADTAQEGIWAVDLGGRTLYVNQMTADLLRRRLAEVYARTPAELLALDPKLIAERVRGARAGGRRQFDHPYVTPDGEARVLRVSVADLPHEEGQHIIGALMMISDVTETVATQEELARQALHDPLTGLGNRTLLLDRLTNALNRATRRPAGRVAVLFADLDHLKEVNDSYGHAEGDALLREVAARIARSVRPGDTVARFGGDEFVVLCEDTDEPSAREIAKRLLEVLEEGVQLTVGRYATSASVGLAISPPDEPDALLHEADLAMYEAKRRGRAQVVVRAGE
jgi:diguanylate cyclase (GGDEF)-like protein/PAS domain S-box-containing protein